MGELTPANTDLYLIPFSMALSIDPLIIGEYPFNNSLSLWSNKHRDSAYVTIISQFGWGVARDER